MDALVRIIDASGNRAREGLRVMEDLARFALDDEALSGDLKALRHDLRAAMDAVPGLDRGRLLAIRDTEADVGTSISTAGERSRGGMRDLALAASGRLTEALRSLEEAAKALGGDGRGFEAIRYRAYTLEQRLGLAIGPGTCPQWRLCILITESLCRLPWEEVAEAAIAGGADCLQLREKALEGGELLSRAKRVVAMAAAASHEVAVIVNDRPDIALLSGARGVHLGQEDLPIAEVRRLAGDRLWIGVSTAGLDQARRAARAGADYCGVGPMFTTTTKHKPILSGPAYLRSYLADPVTARLPHLAIGGVNAANAGELAEAGCRGVAVSSAVCGAENPERLCRELIRALELRARTDSPARTPGTAPTPG